MQHARPNRLRRAVAYAALAALLGVVTLLLSQCMMVGDNVTGVSIDKAQRANCIGNCQDVKAACIDQAQHDCAGDAACLDAAIAVCQSANATCKNNCHKQGAGSSG
jgi:hypothetical protein